MISLRDYNPTDLLQLVQLANNENVSRYLVYSFPFPYTSQDGQWWIETGSRQNKTVTKVIEYEGEFVSSVGLTPQSGWKKHIAEIGYWVGEPYWGKGIATEACRVMSDLAFNTLKFTKICAPVISRNTVSMSVLAKCGYILEGVLKQEVRKRETYYDIYHYAKYKE